MGNPFEEKEGLAGNGQKPDIVGDKDAEYLEKESDEAAYESFVNPDFPRLRISYVEEDDGSAIVSFAKPKDGEEDTITSENIEITFAPGKKAEAQAFYKEARGELGGYPKGGEDAAVEGLTKLFQMKEREEN